MNALLLPNASLVKTLAADALKFPELSLEVGLIKASYSSSVWSISDSWGRRFILKIGKSASDPTQNLLDAGRLKRGFEVLCYLEESCPEFPAPRILSDLLQNPALGDRLYYLQTALPGKALINYHFIPPSFYHHILEELGSKLSQLHAIKGHFFGYFGQTPPFSLEHTWGNAFGHLWHACIENAAQVAYPMPVSLECLCQIYEESKKVLVGNFSPVLCHGDLSKANLLVDQEGRFTGFVDWEEVLWAEQGYDLASIQFGELGKTSFYVGYRKFLIREDICFPIRMRLYQLYHWIRYFQILQVPILNERGQKTGKWRRSNLSPKIDEEFLKVVDSFY